MPDPVGLGWTARTPSNSNQQTDNTNMTTSKLSVMTALLLGSFALSQTLALAADAPKPSAKPKTAAKAAAPAKDRVARLADRLQLTADQQDKLRPILKQETDKLKEESQASQAARAKIREESAAKVKAARILTDDQFAKWQAMQPKAASTTGKTTAPAAAKPKSAAR